MERPAISLDGQADGELLSPLRITTQLPFGEPAAAGKGRSAAGWGEFVTLSAPFVSHRPNLGSGGIASTWELPVVDASEAAGLRLTASFRRPVNSRHPQAAKGPLIAPSSSPGQAQRKQQQTAAKPRVGSGKHGTTKSWYSELGGSEELQMATSLQSAIIEARSQLRTKRLLLQAAAKSSDPKIQARAALLSEGVQRRRRALGQAIREFRARGYDQLAGGGWLHALEPGQSLQDDRLMETSSPASHPFYLRTPTGGVMLASGPANTPSQHIRPRGTLEVSSFYAEGSSTPQVAFGRGVGMSTNVHHAAGTARRNPGPKDERDFRLASSSERLAEPVDELPPGFPLRTLSPAITGEPRPMSNGLEPPSAREQVVPDCRHSAVHPKRMAHLALGARGKAPSESSTPPGGAGERHSLALGGAPSGLALRRPRGLRVQVPSPVSPADAHTSHSRGIADPGRSSGLRLSRRMEELPRPHAPGLAVDPVRPAAAQLRANTLEATTPAKHEDITRASHSCVVELADASRPALAGHQGPGITSASGTRGAAVASRGQPFDKDRTPDDATTALPGGSGKVREGNSAPSSPSSVGRRSHASPLVPAAFINAGTGMHPQRLELFPSAANFGWIRAGVEYAFPIQVRNVRSAPRRVRVVQLVPSSSGTTVADFTLRVRYRSSVVPAGRRADIIILLLAHGPGNFHGSCEIHAEGDDVGFSVPIQAKILSPLDFAAQAASATGFHADILRCAAEDLRPLDITRPGDLVLATGHTDGTTWRRVHEATIQSSPGVRSRGARSRQQATTALLQAGAGDDFGQRGETQRSRASPSHSLRSRTAGGINPSDSLTPGAGHLVPRQLMASPGHQSLGVSLRSSAGFNADSAEADRSESGKDAQLGDDDASSLDSRDAAMGHFGVTSDGLADEQGGRNVVHESDPSVAARSQLSRARRVRPHTRLAGTIHSFIRSDDDAGDAFPDATVVASSFDPARIAPTAGQLSLGGQPGSILPPSTRSTLYVPDGMDEPGGSLSRFAHPAKATAVHARRSLSEAGGKTPGYRMGASESKGVVTLDKPAARGALLPGLRPLEQPQLAYFRNAEGRADADVAFFPAFVIPGKTCPHAVPIVASGSGPPVEFVPRAVPLAASQGGSSSYETGSSPPSRSWRGPLSGAGRSGSPSKHRPPQLAAPASIPMGSSVLHSKISGAETFLAARQRRRMSWKPMSNATQSMVAADTEAAREDSSDDDGATGGRPDTSRAGAVAAAMYRGIVARADDARRTSALRGAVVRPRGPRAVTKKVRLMPAAEVS